PKGVINLVLGKGSEVGEPLSSHKDLELVSFTGGIKTGKHIMKQAADHVTKVALELAGKNTNVMFEDADFERAVEQALNGGLLDAGRVWWAGGRIMVDNDTTTECE